MLAALPDERWLERRKRTPHPWTRLPLRSEGGSTMWTNEGARAVAGAAQRSCSR